MSFEPKQIEMPIIYQSYLKLDQSLFWHMGPRNAGRDSCREKNKKYTEVHRTLVFTDDFSPICHLLFCRN
jgi:hypothetical protein